MEACVSVLVKNRKTDFIQDYHSMEEIEFKWRFVVTGQVRKLWNKEELGPGMRFKIEPRN